MRASGILMHITSLPGPYGVGTMGKQAYAFVDFLKKAGQRYWQILPLTPTGYGDSPYQSCSTYAGNHYLIDLELLAEQGLLRKEEISAVFWGGRDDKVDFGALYHGRLSLLHKAWERYPGSEAFDRFCQENTDWLPDFTLFMALKDRYQGAPWYQWEEGLKFRNPDAVWQARRELKDQTRFYSFVQFLFYSQWEALHSYAAQNGVAIIGDVPIYVPYDSVDVWTNAEYFLLDETLQPVAVAGCPPDAFTEDGQLWGNPLYRWDVLEDNGFDWWIRRMGAAGKLYDVVRMDHFRGFEAYWSVPFGDSTARGGKWIKGPGKALIDALQKGLPELSFIAEDLGLLTQEVLDLRDGSGLPGMKVLGFAFDSREPNDYLPHNFVQNCVCYTGTHDNMTMRQWFETAGEDAVAYAAEYMGLTEQEGQVRGTIRTAFRSVADLCVVPMQDWLELGGEARMNFPGTQTDANWTWRAQADFAPETLAKEILALTTLYGRLGD